MEPSISAWDIRFRSPQGSISASESVLARTHRPQECCSSSRINSRSECCRGPGQAQSDGQNDKAEANDLSAAHIAAQSPSDKSPATANMTRAFGDWNATKSDGEG